jgi:hypothetical protein
MTTTTTIEFSKFTGRLQDGDREQQVMQGDRWIGDIEALARENRNLDCVGTLGYAFHAADANGAPAIVYVDHHGGSARKALAAMHRLIRDRYAD